MQQIYYRLERIYPPTVRICPFKGLTKKANRLSSRSIRKDEHNFLYDQLVDPETHLRHSTLKRKKKEAEKAERGGEICGNLLKRVPKSPKFLVFGIFARWELRWNLENGPNWGIYIYIWSASCMRWVVSMWISFKMTAASWEREEAPYRLLSFFFFLFFLLPTCATLRRVDNCGCRIPQIFLIGLVWLF